MKSATNVFCIIGKPGTGKLLIMNSIFANIPFVNKYELKRFVHGTTREITPREIDGITYHFYTQREFDGIDPKEIIESRSYDNVNTGKIEYYFTLKDHLKLGSNYIGMCTTFQYSEIKKWANITQLESPTNRINVYPIYIQAPLVDRVYRIIQRSASDDDIYSACAKILAARYEYNTILENRVIDKYDPRTCFIEYNIGKPDSEKYVNDTIIRFIKDQIDKANNKGDGQ